MPTAFSTFVRVLALVSPVFGASKVFPCSTHAQPRVNDCTISVSHIGRGMSPGSWKRSEMRPDGVSQRPGSHSSDPRPLTSHVLVSSRLFLDRFHILTAARTLHTLPLPTTTGCSASSASSASSTSCPAPPPNVFVFPASPVEASSVLEVIEVRCSHVLSDLAAANLVITDLSRAQIELVVEMCTSTCDVPAKITKNKALRTLELVQACLVDVVDVPPTPTPTPTSTPGPTSTPAPTPTPTPTSTPTATPTATPNSTSTTTAYYDSPLALAKAAALKNITVVAEEVSASGFTEAEGWLSTLGTFQSTWGGDCGVCGGEGGSGSGNGNDSGSMSDQTVVQSLSEVLSVLQGGGAGGGGVTSSTSMTTGGGTSTTSGNVLEQGGEGGGGIAVISGEGGEGGSSTVVQQNVQGGDGEGTQANAGVINGGGGGDGDGANTILQQNVGGWEELGGGTQANAGAITAR